MKGAVPRSLSAITMHLLMNSRILRTALGEVASTTSPLCMLMLPKPSKSPLSEAGVSLVCSKPCEANFHYLKRLALIDDEEQS